MKDRNIDNDYLKQYGVTRGEKGIIDAVDSGEYGTADADKYQAIDTYERNTNPLLSLNKKFNTDEGLASFGKQSDDINKMLENEKGANERTGALTKFGLSGGKNLTDFTDLAVKEDPSRTQNMMSAYKTANDPMLALNTKAKELEIEGRVLENQAKVKEAEQKKGDIAFGNDISGLTSVSKSPNDLIRLKSRYGLAPFDEIVADIQAAGAANNASPETINKAIDNARAEYRLTPMGEAREVTKKVGDTTRFSRYQNYALGAPKVETSITDKAPNFSVTLGNERRAQKSESDLRKEFNDRPAVKDYVEGNTQMNLALSAFKSKPSTDIAKDQTLIIIYNKLLDPPSVVREGEYGRMIKDRAWVSRLEGAISKATSGGAGLSNEDRRVITDAISLYNSSRRSAYSRERADFTRYAEDYGHRPRNVVGTDPEEESNKKAIYSDVKLNNNTAPPRKTKSGIGSFWSQ
jgi:hypothetical protein